MPDSPYDSLWGVEFFLFEPFVQRCRKCKDPLPIPQYSCKNCWECCATRGVCDGKLVDDA